MQTNGKIVLNRKKIQQIENYKFQVGIFDEDLIRHTPKYGSMTSIPKLSLRVGGNAFRRTFTYGKTAQITNSNILQWEKEKGRNYLKDAFNPRKNPNVLQIRDVLKNFKGQMSKLNMQKACQLLVWIWRDFVESNPYHKRNKPSTIKAKGFDAWLRDTRQLQKSVSARFLYKEQIITIKSNN